MIPGYSDFEFDLPGALLSEVIKVLDGMRSAPLNEGSLSIIPEMQGVYQLFLDGNLVYIGKTDAEAGLQKRLHRHASKIQHRNNLKPEAISFKALRIYVFTAVDLETQVIDHYGGQSNVPWNGSGFGSNDPGRERDTTTYKDDHFDALYPIDINRKIDLTFSTRSTASEVLQTLKASLPYVFRYQSASSRSRKPHPDLANTSIPSISMRDMTPQKIIKHIVDRLPSGWQAVKLPSHVILYKEDREYPQGTVIAKST